MSNFLAEDIGLKLASAVQRPGKKNLGLLLWLSGPKDPEDFAFALEEAERCAALLPEAEEVIRAIRAGYECILEDIDERVIELEEEVESLKGSAQ